MNATTERKYHDQTHQPAIELLAQDEAIYYVGGHTGHPLTRDRGRLDAHIWADYINVGMEHGSFDMAGLADISAA
jgi:4-hydroxy-2-oxoheptanedioate aldolase